MCHHKIVCISIVIFILITVAASAQPICSLAKLITKNYYVKHAKHSSVFDTLNLPTKINHTIQFNFAGKKVILKDHLADNDYFKYFYAGNDRKRNWLLIKKQGYNQEYYYLFNNSTKTIDTLAGSPIIYGTKIICLEGSYTDSPNYIEIWDIQGDKLVVSAKFSLSKKCNIYPTEIALSDKMEVLLKDSRGNYWKTEKL